MTNNDDQVLTSMLLTKPQVKMLMNFLSGLEQQEIAKENNILNLCVDSIGTQLREIRMLRHIKSQDIATATNYSPSMISRVESGGIAYPDLQKLSLWVRALGYDGFKIVWYNPEESEG